MIQKSIGGRPKAHPPKTYVKPGSFNVSKVNPAPDETQEISFYGVDVNLIVHRIAKPSKRMRALAFRSFAP